MLTRVELEKRRAHLCSTDAPRILGVAPRSWGSEADVYDSKIEPLPDVLPEPTEWQQFGSDVEPILLQMVDRELGGEVRRVPFRVCASEPILASHGDGKIVGQRRGVEAKLVTGEFAGDWGDDDDSVPRYVRAQCVHHMVCYGWELVYVPVIIQAYRLVRRIYTVRRDEQELGQYVDYARKWWNYHVGRKVRPTGHGPPDMHVLRWRKREPNKIIELPQEALDAWRTSKEVAGRCKTDVAIAQSEIIDALGDAEAARFPDGTLVTYYEQSTGGRVNRAAMKADGVLEKYVTPKTTRVLRETNKPQESENGEW